MIYVIIILAIFLLELIIKNKIETRKFTRDKEPLFGGKIIISKHHNKGAFLNLGQKWRPLVAVLSMVITSILLIVFLITFTRKGQVGLKISMSLILGGGFSNTYDRLHRKYVVDYFSINSKLFGLKNIVFNIADFFIMIGAILMIIFYDK